MDRTRFIGGSDIAKLADCSPWGNPTTVWLEKMGQTKDESNRFKEWGKKLEPVIIEDFAARHKELRIAHKGVRTISEAYSFLSGEADAIYYTPEGKKGILEVKTTSQYNDKEWQDGNAPDHYLLQCQWYMGLFGAEEGYLAVLIGGSDYREVPIKFNPRLHSNLVKIAVDFWENYIVTKTPPPLTSADGDTLKLLYPAEVPGKVIAVDKPTDFVSLLEQKKAERKALDAQIEGMENEIKAALGVAEVGIIDNNYVAEYKTVERKAYEVKASSYRKLTIKPITRYKGALPNVDSRNLLG